MEKKSVKKKHEHVPKEVSELNKKEEHKRAPKLMNDYEIALDFATRVHQKFDRLVKASILFGSQAKNTATEKSDVDIILIIDDAAIAWDLELVAWYREELGKLVQSSAYPRELHINSIKLTTWWQDLMEGDPVVINIVRYGRVLIDSGGFFNPLKILLQQGKIKSTVESVYMALQRAPMHLLRSKAAKVGAIEGIYWAMIDAAQAALVTAGKLPPSPEHIPLFLKETFVDQGMCKEDFAYAVRDIYTLHKRITYGEIRDIRGADLDSWYETAENFIIEMTRLIDAAIEKAKEKQGSPLPEATEEPSSPEMSESEELPSESSSEQR